ncbi:hypothetical protein [Flavobacterium humi]|uniref:Uncharacterized protein n=1 Tax=Flavobacterium humi TaxID=2562683 RepID=A0A4Z0LCE4_9FLAO|nr:hypothetical protein [Flavobacterium humi]TGD59562.1 hypothetical protein E4635_01105 [Flavobacterium humi]
MKQFDLDNDPKITPGFKVPEHYFEQFEDKMMAQLPQRMKVIPLWQRRPAWIASAAAIFIIAIGTWAYFAQDTAENVVADQEYLAYESDVTTEDIALLLSDEDISAVENSLNLYHTESEAYINEYLN